MGKITQPVKAWGLLLSFTFLTFVIITASTAVITSPRIDLISVSNASCSENADGSIDIEVADLSGTYSYSWVNLSDSEFSSNAEVPGALLPGIYQVTVTDDNGSTTSDPITVGVNDDQKPGIINLPTDIVIDTAGCEAIATWTEPSSADNCTDHRIEQTGGPANGSTFPTGTTIITYTATDASNNIHSDTFTVTVNDTVAPVITNLPEEIQINRHAGECGGWASWETPTAEDNCELVKFTSSHNSDDFFPTGTTTVTYTAEDSGGLVTTASFDIVILDDEAPVFAAEPSIEVPADEDTCGAALDITAPVATDNCEIVTIKGIRDDGEKLDAIYPLGTTTITWTATDAHDNVGEEFIQTITVVDKHAPIITADNLNITTDEGLCGAFITSVFATVIDNCELANELIGVRDDQEPLEAIFPVGVTTITWNVTDINNNAAQEVVQTITVTDKELPVITAEPIERLTDAGECFATITIDLPTATDNCGLAAETVGVRNDGQELNAGYPVGTTIITWTVTDINNNAVEVTQTVTVTDEELPVITPDADITTTTDAENCTALVEITSPTANDNCGLATEPTGTREDGLELSAPYPVGTTVITWTVTDLHDNPAEQVIQKVTVTDKELPVIIAEPIERLTDAKECFATITIDPPTATDNCGLAAEPMGVRNDGEELDAGYPVGTTIITWTVTDINNNHAVEVTQDVTVTDEELPVITAEPDINATAEEGACTAEVTIKPATAIDNCGLAGEPVGTRDDGMELSAPYPIGTTIIRWTIEDLWENTASEVLQKVVVTDTEYPTITGLPEDIEVGNSMGGCEVEVNWPEPGSMDNCTGHSIIQTEGPANGSTFTVGTTTTITYTATDASGNSHSESFTVTVEDIEPPVPPTLPDIWTSCEITLTPPATRDNCTAETLIKVSTEDPITYKPQNNISEHIITWKFEDEAGNISFAEQKLTINPLIAFVTSTPTTCHGGNDGTIRIEASGGRGPYEYSLNNNSFDSILFYEDLSAGVYTVRIKDASGCILEKEIEITEPDILRLITSQEEEIVSSTPESCYGASDGTIKINGDLSGGTGRYLFSVDNINFSGNPIPGLSAGTYEVFIKDSNGCTLPQIVSATVDGPPKMEAIIEVAHPICFDSSSGSIKLLEPTGGKGTPYSFRINGGDWQSTTSSLGYNFTALSAGEYKIEMKDGSGCLRTLDTVTLEEPDKLVIDITKTRTTTFGSATAKATAEPSGGNGTYTYQWRNSDGNLIGDTQTVTGLRAGTYTVSVTDGKECNTTREFEIFDKMTAEIEAISLCKETADAIRTSTFQVDLERTMGGEGDPYKYNYSWDFGEGASRAANTTTGIGPFEVIYSSTGDKVITLTVTDESGTSAVFTFGHYVGACFEECDSANNFSSVQTSFYLGDAAGNKMDVNDCDLDESMYLWFIVDKSANGYKLSSELVYTVTSNEVTRQYRTTNCFSNPDGSQLVPEQLIRLNEVGPDEDQINWKCDETLNIVHITYRWTSNAKKVCGDTNNNHCASTNQTISVAAPIRATAETSNTCHGQTDGWIIISAYGGTGEFLYSAKNNTTGDTYTSEINVFNDLPAGNYTVTVTDKKEVAAGQEKSFYVIENLIIDEADRALQAKVSGENVSCYGANDGIAKVTETSGGTEPYTYLWNDSRAQTDPEAEDLRPGTYTVIITDALGCTVTKSVEITGPAKITTPKAGPDQIRCGFTSTNLEANVPVTGIGTWKIIKEPSPGSGNIADLNDANSEFSVEEEGEYILEWTIADADGNCSSSDSVLIEIMEDCNFLDFDGVDDYVHFGKEPYGFESGAFSMEAWVKLKSTFATKTILSKRDRSIATGGGYELVMSSGGVPTFRVGGKTISPNSSVPLNTQRWYHIAVTFNGSTAKLYVDGLEVNSQALTNPGSTEAPFLIGATYDSSNSRSTRPESHFHGWIEEVRLWKRALTTEQIRFMMNQRLEQGTIIEGTNNVAVKGKELPLNVPGALAWKDLAGYYPLLAPEITGDGTTEDLADEKVPGVMKNITTLQENTAPLPYISKRDGNWRDIESNTTPWLYGRGLWDAPNSLGINQKPIDWNIVRISHNIISGNKDITVLGLISQERVSPEGLLESNLIISNPHYAYDETNPGHFLRVTDYLRLDGKIDLAGESQLLQDQGSILDSNSKGYLERDQQGTASSFNYNYWSSPVSSVRDSVNAGYTIKAALWGGTDSQNPHEIDFNYRYAFADGAASTPIKISTFWLHKFYGEAGQYSQWHWLGENGHLKAGQGFTMKGTQNVSVFSGRTQNYVFRGLPNNGDINLEIAPATNYLVGNPYPSALDADQFIKDNLAKADGTGKNVFNGSLYFWSHFSGQTHYLPRYVGGYATYNLSGGVQAVANDARINATGAKGGNIPKRYIPVGQAFFVNTVVDDAIVNWQDPHSQPQQVTIVEGDVRFRNSQRIFQREDLAKSVFHSQETTSKEQQQEPAESTDSRKKIWITFDSPTGYHRQILVTADPESSYNFDLGYDAPLIDDVAEDMYWMLHKSPFVIQGIPDFIKDKELPLGMRIEQEGEFKIAIDTLENIPHNFAIYVKDSLTNELHDLRASPFKLTVPPDTINNRFSIVFPNEQTTPLIEEKEDLSLDRMNLFYTSKDSEIIIQNYDLIPVKKAYLYNMNGQTLGVFKDIPTDNLVRIPVSIRTSGIYIFKVETEKGKKSVKFIIGSE